MYSTNLIKAKIFSQMLYITTSILSLQAHQKYPLSILSTQPHPFFEIDMLYQTVKIKGFQAFESPLILSAEIPTPGNPLFSNISVIIIFQPLTSIPLSPHALSAQ